MRELQGRWPGLDRGRWEVGGGSSVTAQAPNGRLRELGCAGWQENRQHGTPAELVGASWRGRWVSGERAPSSWEWNGSQPVQGATDVLLPRLILGKMQSEAACRASEPSGQGEDPSSEGLGGHDPFTQADAGSPAGQVVRHHLYRSARRRWRRSGRTACGSVRHRS